VLPSPRHDHLSAAAATALAQSVLQQSQTIATICCKSITAAECCHSLTWRYPKIKPQSKLAALLFLQGLTEQQVVQRDLHAEVYTTTFIPLKARLAARAEGASMQQGFVKMLVEVGSGKVLGLHMVGEDAPEIVQVGVMVLLLCTIPTCTALVYSTCVQLCTRSSVLHLCSHLGFVVCRVW
jgi:hypothetical protein